MQQQPGLSAADRLLAVTSPCFDIAALELFLPVVTGAKVVIADQRTIADGVLLAAELERHDITVMQATPATWRLLVDSGWSGTSGLKALCGGEALPRNLADELLLRADALWNLYGPTETTVWSSVCRLFFILRHDYSCRPTHGQR
jgi:non-ribosomal peptide synthetase component F